MAASFGTYTELVLAHSAQLAEQDAFVYLSDTAAGDTAHRLTYAQLDTSAKRIASWLQERGGFGRQVLVLYPSGIDFIPAFIGCLYAGSVAVPAPLPGEQGQHFARVTSIVRNAQVCAVLTDSGSAPKVRAWLDAEGLADIPVLATDTAPGEAAHYGDPAAWSEPDFGPEHLAFLQYTSGSTSTPKGVMVTHGNLLANETAIQRSCGSTSASRVGGWLPFYHDMGLIGHILQPLFLGSTGVLMSPISFLKRPYRWLRMIDDHGIEVGGGPNFAYDLCTRRVTDEQLAQLDLSRWTVACNGAEPIRADTLAAFAERFAPAGFRAENFFPCYGMAETTLLITGTPRGKAPVERTVNAAALERGGLTDAGPGVPARTLVSSGVLREDFEVAIVDPEDLTEQPPGRIGEIWVKGASVCAGYWGNPVATRDTFRAAISGEAGARAAGWLRTGDLGVLDGDELYVTGRLKEMILINGRNLYPHDVERAVREVDPALAGSSAVFSVDTGREQLVIVHEARVSRGGPDPAELAGRVQVAISREFAVPVENVVLVRPGGVRRTTSGKIRRTMMRELFLAGGVTPVHAVLNRDVAALVRPAAPVRPSPALETVG
ncbi:MAG TPA: fatty acyl-AMP ligase [Actinocrinis sp.]|nr:fatty acyl-AMP ligase [Actinocrinis sp.]